MAKLGLPYLSIEFREQGIARIAQSERGIVALVLQDSTVTGNYTIYSLSDIPEDLSEENKEQIRLTMMGYQRTPRRIELVVESSPTAEEGRKFDVTSPGFKYLETIRWDWLAVPFADEEDSGEIATWVKSLNENLKKRCKCVVAIPPVDYEKVVHITDNHLVDDNGKSFTATQYTARFAGLLAGTPMQISSTYATLPELKSCSQLAREEINEKIGSGELVLINDGRKIKVARGVNGLTTTSEVKGESFRKIKIVEIMDAMADDIVMTTEDSYLGKYANSYDNKVLLMSAIKGYMEVLENDGLLAKGSSKVEINIEAQKAYLKSIGFKTADGRTPDEMEIFEIREADTKDKVFIVAYCKILDAIEEINLIVNI